MWRALAYACLASATVMAACAAGARDLPLEVARGQSPAVPTCESCHVKEAAEHERSFHRVAFIDATYQASLALEAPKEHAFCNGCHAPAGREAGVGCVSCHGETHTPRARVASESCKSCHQFAFNDGRADLVQRTVEEHDASPFAATPCVGCHSTHVFEAGHSLKWLRGSIEVKAKRRGNHALVAITPWTGHAFPTGDMFRRARLLLFGERDDGTIVASAERTFGRTWGGDANGFRKELSDTRIRGHFEEDIDLTPTSAEQKLARIRYSVVFERVLAQRADQVDLVSSDEIAAGEAK